MFTVRLPEAKDVELGEVRFKYHGNIIYSVEIVCDTGAAINLIPRRVASIILSTRPQLSEIRKVAPISVHFTDKTTMRLDETIVLDFSLRIGADEVQAHGIEFYVYDPIETADDALAPLILGQPTLRDLGFGLVKLPSSKRVHFAAPLQVRDDIIRECFNESRLPTDEELRFIREQTIEDQRTIADKGFQDMIAHLRAKTDILTHEQIEKLVDQANRYRDIFRYGLPEQACTISALAERLNTSHVPPTRPRFLNLSPEREYKTWSHLIILLSMGVLSVYKTGTVPYACPSLAIFDLAQLIRPLDRVVGDARTAVGSSKASELKKYKLTEGMWTAELDSC